ncbi:low molecular weight phosphotyrosine protein phosphatase [Jannaschia sp. Os4]|uniref:arsenate reductase/protein-tyrosine-phosphatase family protein n=1 Tax=Jannaschia sp. Os4 TaxID=2807617 RepID=UPI00193A6AB8|nr:low molecular weight phosphotyrosine protein phosphatase [Jannaschia sp. Os4]MBM2575042.1 low molecular weight phosphotyrosine protein phosphatase [Jannaschia sp. Os4]
MRILFVCVGSTCRSPAAAHLAKALRPDWTTDHAGTAVRHVGAPVDPRMATRLKARDLDPAPSRARQFRSNDFDRYDLVLALEARNLRDLDGLRPGLMRPPHVRLLSAAAGLGERDIADPYDTGDYTTALAAIDAAVAGLSARYPVPEA